MNERATGLVQALATRLLHELGDIDPQWTKAYYRFRDDTTRYGSNASYERPDAVKLIAATQRSAFYAEMNELGRQLFEALGQASGVFLLIVDAGLDYDVRFEWTDLKRWEITKLNGGTGIPAGL